MQKKEKYDPISEMQGSAKAKREAYEWISTFAQALFGVVIVFTFLVRFVTVDGQSMENTLQHGDRLIISDVNYTPKRGDIVVVHNPSEVEFSGPVIKRVIATAGETVKVDYQSKSVTVIDKSGNEYLLEEPYIATGNCTYGVDCYNTHSWLKPSLYHYSEIYTKASDYTDSPYGITDAVFTVGEGEVFVCGDNRAHSLDSRYVGCVDERQILGKVLVRVFPNPAVMNHMDYEEIDGKLVAKK